MAKQAGDTRDIVVPVGDPQGPSMLRYVPARCTACLRAVRSYSATPQHGAPSASVSASSSAQPLSTPTTPSASNQPRPKKAKALKSSCEAGTVMKGLNIMKAGSDPVALPESEYPAFLWTVLDRSDIGERKEVRKVNRAQIKRKNFFSGKL